MGWRLRSSVKQTIATWCCMYCGHSQFACITGKKYLLTGSTLFNYHVVIDISRVMLVWASVIWNVETLSLSPITGKHSVKIYYVIIFASTKIAETLKRRHLPNYVRHIFLNGFNQCKRQILLQGPSFREFNKYLDHPQWIIR